MRSNFKLIVCSVLGVLGYVLVLIASGEQWVANIVMLAILGPGAIISWVTMNLRNQGTGRGLGLIPTLATAVLLTVVVFLIGVGIVMYR
ncbi:hypothetical protein [Actinomadura sp. WMMA1423]|uniref:hypothetical protein n=1 Tax=Actinomadura sp. WMMA1423 TaxID=2591108 RepID=UPI0011462DE1|nr:hypothetical protein [Actinomadura sp. WMMA1423]